MNSRPLTIIAAQNIQKRNRAASLQADARTRSYRRRVANGETQAEIAASEGVSQVAISRSITRVLPEDMERQAPRGATHGLSRGQVAYALGFEPYAI